MFETHPHPLPSAARRAHPTWRRKPGAWLLAALCALSTPVWAAQADDDTRLQEAAQLADRYVQPALQFRPCAENASLDCGTLRVPLDYRKPWAGSVDLAVTRARSTVPGKRIGVLVANLGGPSESGVEFVLNAVNNATFKRVRERFDVVSFDVRGSHRSGAVSCAAPLPVSPTVAPIDEFSKQIAQNCVQQHGALVTSMSTNNNARDIDILRRSLRETRISFYGVSYGTALGAVYASMFPHNVRAMLLDAPMYPHFRDGLVDFEAQQILLGFESTLQYLDQRCAADPACRLRGTGVVNMLRAVKTRLAQAPVAGPGGALLTVSGMESILSGLLDSESSWPLIVDALADAQTGNLALLFQLLAQATNSANSASASRSSLAVAAEGPLFQISANTIIFCNDFSTRRSAAEYLPVSEVVTAVSSLAIGRFDLLGRVGPCAAWPAAEEPLMRRLSGPAAPPILLLSAHHDSNTPFGWARSMADVLDLESRLVRYQGGGHGTYGGSGPACMTAIGDAFLFDLVVPPEGTSCAPRPIAFRPAASATTDAVAREQVQQMQRSRGWVAAPL
jgi:pimeloyl-ACP methyl ester carboxylesterase